ncbi:MAG: PRC-barrel domain-containing protein [Candidatus Melainabacteria bacterium]|nr:PRC-barrel domain-containing protein [Candidatus Melainabacteria bacterium]
MLRSVDSLRGYSLHATDGKIGTVRSLHFDDESWQVRYLVVHIDSWLDDKDVLILPAAAFRVVLAEQSINVDLSRKQIKEAQPYSSDLPVSAQHELIDKRNFAALYLADPWSGSVLPMWFPDTDAVKEVVEATGDKDLRCTAVVDGYKVIDKGGKPAGKVKDFIVDDEAWEIKFLVVDTNGIYPFGDVLVSNFHVDGFETDEQLVSIDMSKAELEQCPKYDSFEPVNREYVLKHYDFEGRLVKTSRANVEDYEKLDSKLKDD